MNLDVVVVRARCGGRGIARSQRLTNIAVYQSGECRFAPWTGGAIALLVSELTVEKIGTCSEVAKPTASIEAFALSCALACPLKSGGLKALEQALCFGNTAIILVRPYNSNGRKNGTVLGDYLTVHGDRLINNAPSSKITIKHQIQGRANGKARPGSVLHTALAPFDLFGCSGENLYDRLSVSTHGRDAKT